MALNTIRDLFVHHLNIVYGAEKQMSESLPRIVSAAVNPELQEFLQEHLETTEEQVSRLDTIFEELGLEYGGIESKGMKGIIEESNDILSAEAEDRLRDSAIIAIIQKFKHYEIASYGAVATYARELGYKKVAQMLRDTFDEEQRTDHRLNRILTGGIFGKSIDQGAPRT